jgi:hypothetical protein
MPKLASTRERATIESVVPTETHRKGSKLGRTPSSDLRTRRWR